MSDFDHFTRNGAPVYISRRRFLRGAAATGGVAALAGLGPLERAFGQSLLPSPEASGIEHIVVVMMENRSYDHFLGWYDGADGRQGGLRYADASGALHRTHRLAPDYQGCGHPDPDHSYEGGRIEYNNGACDGWLRAGDNDEYAIGYYVKKDLDFTARRCRTGRRATGISRPSWPGRLPIACISTPRKPIASETRSSSARCRRFGIVWPRRGSKAGTISAIFHFLRCGADRTSRSRGPSHHFLPTPRLGRCLTSPSSNPDSSEKSSACQTTITRMQTFETARRF